MAAPAGNAPIRVGLVGCGRWGRHILRDLRALGCEVAVATTSDESRRRAREGGAATIVARGRDLPEVAGVVVASTTSTHAEAIDEVLDRGVPIFVEKPMTDDAAAAARLAEAAPDRLFVMDKWRYHPGVREIARIAREGELGAPLGIHARRVAWGVPHADVDPVWILAPHDLAIALEVLGELPEPRSAIGEVVEGRLRGLHAVLGGHPWTVLEISELAPAHRRELRVVFEEGVAQLDGGYADAVVVARAEAIGSEAVEHRPLAGAELPLLAELRAFVEHLAGGPPPRSSAAEGAAIVATVARLRELATAGTGRVRVDAPEVVA